MMNKFVQKIQNNRLNLKDLNAHGSQKMMKDRLRFACETKAMF
jgi:hypothetical protein